MKIIDVNAGFGFWPIQRFSNHTLEELDVAFAKARIDEVWLSAIESILFPEPDSWDTRLFLQLERFPRFRGVKTVNPLLANWHKEWDRNQASMVAVKLFPNYHGYPLSDPRVDEVAQKAAETGIPVLIQMRVNDERNQPHFLQVGGVSAQELVALSQRNLRTQFIALCCYGSELSHLAQGGRNLLADIAFLDGEGVIERAAERFPADRLVFGSHEAFAHVEASRMKLWYAGSEALVQGIASGNILRPLE